MTSGGYDYNMRKINVFNGVYEPFLSALYSDVKTYPLTLTASEGYNGLPQYKGYSIFIDNYTHTYIYIYTYISMCITYIQLCVISN